MRSVFSSVIIAMIGVCAVDAYAAVGTNDFTRANTTFTKRRFEQAKEGNPFDNRRFREMDKKFDKKTFDNIPDVSHLQDKRAYFGENLQGESLTEKLYYDNKKEKLGLAEYKGKTKDDLWADSDKKLHLDNSDRNLSKKYVGKIDTEKRNMPHQEYLKDQYSEIMEMSMREINKYFFRSSHSDEGGIETFKAGGGSNADESSFWDFMSPNKTIRSKVKIRKYGNGEKTSIPKQISKEENEAIKKANSAVLQSQVQPLSVQNKPQSSVVPTSLQASQKNLNTPTLPQQPRKSFTQPTNTNVRALETVDATKAKQYDFIRVPDSLKSGGATIKVEVKD